MVPDRAAVEALPRISIDKFGAVANDSSTGAALANARAIEAAVRASAGSAGVAVVPAGFEYDVLPVELFNLTDASLLIEGTLSVHQNITAWPLLRPGTFKPVISMTQTTGFALLGTDDSLIEGHGLEWWWVRVLNIVNANTPTLVYASHCEGTLVSGIRTSNSPRYNFYLEQQRALEVERVHIWTDWGGAVGALERTGRLPVSHSDARGVIAGRMAAETDVPREAALAAVDAWIERIASSGISGGWHAASLTVRMMAAESSDAAIPFPGIPMYPLNTDGVDVAGQGIWIHDCNVTNWDDSYCVKPQTISGGGSIGCTQNITIEDSIVLFGVGASMGSVPPHPTVNCIRDVIVRNISFTAPTKTLYVKTNGGNSGTGIIENVHYSDIRAKEGFWYPIYVGPQQQKEPNGGGDGWWPPTQPRVTVGNITFDNVQMDDVLWPQPGVLRCNVTNPCQGIDLRDVTLTSSLWNASTFQWVCEQTYGAFDGLENRAMLVTKLLAIALSVAAMAVSASASLRSTAQEDPVPEGMFRCSTGELRADPLNCPAGGRVAFSNKATIVSAAKGRCADGTEVSDEANCDGTNVMAPPSYDGKVEVPQGHSTAGKDAPKFRQTLGAVLAGVPVFKAGSKL